MSSVDADDRAVDSAGEPDPVVENECNSASMMVSSVAKEHKQASHSIFFSRQTQRAAIISPGHMKYISLFLLALQNAALILVMRYVRTRPGELFASSTAVVMSELLKVGVCLGIIWFEQGATFSLWYSHLSENIFRQPRDCLRISVPAFVYMIQNNLIYVAASNLDAATFQVTYQLKILTTAVLSVVMLRKQLSRLQWVSLLLLFIGVAAVNIQANAPSSETKTSDDSLKLVAAVTVAPKVSIDQQPIIGFLAVLTACVLSGFAGVYFEKILKSTPQSIFVRNVQLGVIGGILGVGAVFVSGDGAKVRAHGFFYGYDFWVLFVIMLHGLGGIVVAVVVKYADNILKGFAASAAIVVSCIASMYMFDFQLSALFLFGTSLVILSTYMYSRFVPSTSPTHKSAVGSSSTGSRGGFDEAPLIKIIRHV